MNLGRWAPIFATVGWMTGSLYPTTALAQTPSGQFVTAVNAGGGAYTALDGTVFAADNFNNGNMSSTMAAIANTDDDALYQIERWAPGGFTYDVPVTNGDYIVQMHFIEAFQPNYMMGARVFDILLEGQTVYDDVDIFVDSGGPNTALVLSAIVTVTDGMLTLTTTAEVENPKINAFTIYEYAPDTQAPTVSTSYRPPLNANDTLGVTVTFTDDQGLDSTSVDLTDVVITGSGQPLQILSERLVYSASGAVAAAEFEVQPTGGWVADTITVDVAGSQVEDAAGNLNAAFTDGSFTYSGPVGPFILAVNSGGAAPLLASNGLVYQADNFAAGTPFSIGRAIAGTDDPSIFQSEVFGPQGADIIYDVPVPNGPYGLDLYFAEIFNQINAPGQRVFDVFVEGQLVLDDFDIFAQVGAVDTALIVPLTAVVTDGSMTIQVTPVTQNAKISGFVIYDPALPPTSPALRAFADPAVQALIDTTDAVSGVGEVTVDITPNGNNVQQSNFGSNSFTLTNVGTKRIAAVFFDVSDSVFRDVIFDPDGTGGDSVAKALSFDSGVSATLPFDPSNASTAYPNLWLPARAPSFDPTVAFNPNLLSDVNNLFVDETADNTKSSPQAGGGFRGQLLIFDDFGPGESMGFSSDMDPNSIAGLNKGTVDTASNQAGTGSNFDVGGVSGAEMTGSVITVLFGDGSIGTAILGHDGSQTGGHAFVSTAAANPRPTADLLVDGFLPGDTGVYGVDRPEVVVTGPPGSTVRVTFVKGFDPVGNTATVANGQITVDALVEARLLSQYPEFPVSNAVEWQHIDVLIPASGAIDITYGFGGADFDYLNVATPGGAANFTGADVLPIAFVAAVVDANGVPTGPVTEPITLINQGGPAACEDRDGDGVTDCAGDCDDTDGTVFPGADEFCDGIDNNCDTLVDDGSAIDALTFYADMDGDGFGDPAAATLACSAPLGFVADDTDCDDMIATINPGEAEVCDGIDNDCSGMIDGFDATDAVEFYFDGDGDGYGITTNTQFACAAPQDFAALTGDCDDTNGDINPGEAEACNGFDDNCDGQTDGSDSVDAMTYYADSDNDLFGDPTTSERACAQPTGFVLDMTDCNDNDGDVNPGEMEVCNGIDDDCSGQADGSDAVDALTWYADDDTDGFGNAAISQLECVQPAGFVEDDTDCDDTRSFVNPMAPEICDGFDNDCNGTVDPDDSVGAPTWYADSDNDLFGNVASSTTACLQPSGFVADATDCDDTSGGVFPGAVEFCNTVDDDCDGTTDEDDAQDASTWYADTDNDQFGNAASTTVACAAPTGFVADATDCDDSSGSVFPGADEFCNTVDDDCDGTVDEDDAVDAPTWYADTDNDMFGNAASSAVACAAPTGFVADATDCDDSSGSVFPGADEFCNTVDDDCDGTVDEDDALDASTWYADTDNDMFGNAASSTQACAQPTGFVADATDCDDTLNSVFPGADEFCNGIDDNCNSAVDEARAVDASTWYADTDNDMFGDANNTTEACNQPAGFVADATDCDDSLGSVFPGADEFCNGIDDNCDTMVDETTAVDAATWYADTDNDMFGDANTATPACDQPTGFVADATDCDDGSGSVFPGAPEFCNGIDDNCDNTVDESTAQDASIWYADTDNDQFGDANVTEAACAQPSGFVADATDCDDSRAATNPGATEFCNTFDDDCDGTTDEDDAQDAPTWYADTDNDQFGDANNSTRACAVPAGFVANATDCNDGASAVNPDAVESCNGIDDNCDGSTDGADSSDASTFYADVDTDGFGDAGSPQLACAQPTGFVADNTDCDDTMMSVNPNALEVCNQIDDNCNAVVDDGATDAVTWYRDGDSDGFGDASDSLVQCPQPDGYVMDDTDCDDVREDVNPGQDEVCDDNDVDEDCDGQADGDDALGQLTFYADSDLDGFGDETNPIQACQLREGLVEGFGDCDDTDDVVFPGAPEDCSDRRDTNCDGLSGADDLDEDGVEACDDCDDSSAARFPGAEETCDGIDNDCDDVVDNDAVDASLWFVDSDGDGFGLDEVLACAQPDGTVAEGGDCDDTAASVFPGAEDEVGDGIDQDCDGSDAPGCSGCSTNGPPSMAWLALVGLGVLLRRRRPAA